MQADAVQYQLERKSRAAAKILRNRKLHDDAMKDKRRQNTYLKLWRAYLRLVRDASAPENPITVADLCRKAEVSEAAFHKNLAARTADGVIVNESTAEAEEAVLAPGDVLSGTFILMLAIIDRIERAVLQGLRREILRAGEEEGRTFDRAERATIAVARLVQHVGRYPRLFQVDGVLPREIILSLSDALGEAIILNESATLQDKADAVAMAKYHTTALVGILRSHLGAQHDRETFEKRLVYVMVSQVVPPLLPARGQPLDHFLDLAMESLGRAKRP
ncbi:hypothetical protein [Mycobacterium sp. EPa45]|uniref:hypothetical protein n=1 Tax=Mycobacterium sp. EPa45 TaxID=1545728 RepID=UPI0011874115|nr:hypothetical protein [Mycobacterium sp. EPa45]